MHPNAERVQEALTACGAQGRVVELSAPTGTAAEAASALGVKVAQIAKSLLFLAGDEPVLVIASGANRVSTKKLKALVGREIRRPDADTVKGITGFPIGGVPPLGHRTALRAFIDQDLSRLPAIWAAAGTPNAVFPCAPQELVRITGGVVVDLAENTPPPARTGPGP